MATDYYVDADSGSDANGGTSWGDAKEHLQAAIDLITGVVNDQTTIHLKAGTTAEYTQEVTIRGIRPLGADAGLTIQPEIWTQSNYDDADGDPFNATPATGIFDITADDKPCVLTMDITVIDSVVDFLGMEFEGKLTSQEMAHVLVAYSRFEGEDAMAFANGYGGLTLENCYLDSMPLPVVAYANSTVSLMGDVYIVNPFITGIWALVKSNVYIAPWTEKPMDYYTLQIKTTSPRQTDFAAIKAVGSSYVFVKSGDINPWDLSVSRVEITNDLDVLPPNYYGVVLESASLLQGASLMSFKTKNKKGDYVDMPAANCFARRNSIDTLSV